MNYLDLRSRTYYVITCKTEQGHIAWSNAIDAEKIPSIVPRKFPNIRIYIQWSTEYARNQYNKISSIVFLTFESIYLKYLKYLQFGHKFELRISNDM